MHQWLHWNDFLYSKSVSNRFLLTCKIVNQPTSVPDDAAWILHRNIERIKMYKLLVILFMLKIHALKNIYEYIYKMKVNPKICIMISEIQRIQQRNLLV